MDKTPELKTFNRRNYFLALRLLVELENLKLGLTKTEIFQIIDAMAKIIKAAEY